MKTKTKRQIAIAKTEKEIYKILRVIAIRKHGERCIICGSTNILQLSHFFPRKQYPRLAYYTSNVHLNCKRCHFIHHKGAMNYAAAWLSMYGSDEFFHLLCIGEEKLADSDRPGYAEKNLHFLTNLLRQIPARNH